MRRGLAPGATGLVLAMPIPDCRRAVWENDIRERAELARIRPEANALRSRRLHKLGRVAVVH